MAVVRDLSCKRRELEKERKVIGDRMTEIDRHLSAIDTVVQIFETNHMPNADYHGFDELFIGDNLAARILNTLRLAQIPISAHECAIRVGSQKGVPESDSRIQGIEMLVSTHLNELAGCNRVEQTNGDDGIRLWRIAL